MDELERAGRILRESVGGPAESPTQVRARARRLVRRRRMMVAGSVVSAVVAIAIVVALTLGNDAGVGVHTIAPTGSSTASVATSAASPHHQVDVQGLPLLSFADAITGWRIDPANYDAIERTTDGGRSWTRQLPVPTSGTGATGVLAIDTRHAFALVFSGTEILTATFERTSDGQHWAAIRGHGLSAPLAGISFVDSVHGWGETEFGDLFTTADGGGTWHAVAGLPTPDAVGAICLGSARSGWAATRRSVYRSDDGGTRWQRQFTAPYDGGDIPSLVCRGSHVAYASFGVGAGQHIGAFVRSDDAGAHWLPLTEDVTPNGPTLRAPGFPDSQIRGEPVAMLADGTMVFENGCYACANSQIGIVVASATDRFSVSRFDGSPGRLVGFRAAAAPDPTHVFVEVGATPTSGRLPPTEYSLDASTDGGRTWQLRWRSQ